MGVYGKAKGFIRKSLSKNILSWIFGSEHIGDFIFITHFPEPMVMLEPIIALKYCFAKSQSNCDGKQRGGDADSIVSNVLANPGFHPIDRKGGVVENAFL